MTAMSTPVEIRWRRFWGVSTRCTSIAGGACSTVSTLIPDLPQEPAQAPAFSAGGGMARSWLLAQVPRRTTR